jgi:short subunit dehydrogenase-like uncharacterized protein
MLRGRMADFLIYGANGYTGNLIAREAAARGMTPMLAGRSAEKVGPLAEELGLPFEAFALDNEGALDSALGQVPFVMHCAGPFSLTSEAMVAGCLRTRTHYTDITGEIAVFESLAAKHGKAKEAGIMLMPGVGFDVVPSDSLAKHLSNRLPDAVELMLAFFGLGRISHGTQMTMTMNIGKGGAIRRDGRITGVPAAWKRRKINFGEFSKLATTIPWGDVATAYYSTGIPNIKVFTVIPDRQLKMLKMSRYIGWLLASGPVQSILQKQIPEGGPTEEERKHGKTFLWGRAEDADGKAVEARLFGPEGYQFTVLAALKVAEQILEGNYCEGFQTPAKCYGAELVLEIDGVRREDVELGA